MGYSKQIIKGFSWAATLNATSLIVSFLKITILSRLVFGPSEFGVFGVGILILGILELLTETGINIFLVQETGPLDKYLDTAWVISIIRGIVISLLLIILAYPISVFFKIQSHFLFLLAFSLIPLIRGFINPAITGLQKNFKFRQDALYRFSISFIEDTSIIILGLLTHNLYSFIVGILIGVIIEVLITFVIVKERPRFVFTQIHFSEIFKRGKWVTLAQIFDYLFEHIDDVVVGRVLNVFSLGIYQNSYTLSSLPENAIAKQLGRITFPVYVQLTQDKPRLKKAFTKTFLLTLIFILPFSIFVFLFSDPMVRIFLGEKWLTAIPVLRILALFGFARAIVNLFYPMFLAFKKQNYVTYTTLISIVVLLICVYPLTLSYGIDGAALSALIGSIAGLPVAYYFYRKIFADD